MCEDKDNNKWAYDIVEALDVLGTKVPADGSHVTPIDYRIKEGLRHWHMRRKQEL